MQSLCMESCPFRFFFKPINLTAEKLHSHSAEFFISLANRVTGSHSSSLNLSPDPSQCITTKSKRTFRSGLKESLDRHAIKMVMRKFESFNSQEDSQYDAFNLKSIASEISLRFNQRQPSLLEIQTALEACSAGQSTELNQEQAIELLVKVFDID